MSGPPVPAVPPAPSEPSAREVHGAASPAAAAPLLLVEENHDLPLARVNVTLRHAGAEDPTGREGLAQFAAELARRGAGGRDREAIDAAFDDLGADLAVSVGPDAAVFDVEVLSSKLDEAMALLADVLLRPDLVDDEADQLRRETHADLDELQEDDPQLARRYFARDVYGDTPYGRTILGTRASIDRLDAPTARRFLERGLSAGTLVFGAAGDVTPARFESLVARRFGALRPGAAPRAELPLVPRRDRPSLTVVDKPGRTQTQILLGQPIIRWADPDFVPLAVAVNAFGGTFTARLMTEVRVKRGLSYGCSARLGQGRGPRALQVYVFPSIERTGETLALLLDLWRDFVEEGLRDDEVLFARENLARSFLLDLVTPDERLDLRVSLAVSGLDPAYLVEAPDRIRAVTPDMARDAVRRHLAPAPSAITLLTTTSALGDQLARLDLDESMSVLPYDSY